MYYISIHRSTGSAPIVVQRPLTSSLGELPDYYDCSGILGFRPCLCPSPFPSPSISRVFFHSVLIAIELSWTAIHSCFFFTTDASAPIGRPFPYSLFGWVSRLGTGSGTQCCSPRGGAGVRLKQKSRFKCLPWHGFEPRTLQSDGRERYY